MNELTSDPINITSYSVMMVNLRLKVLSETVDNQLNSFGPEETAGTGKLCIREENVWFFKCKKYNWEYYKKKKMH